MKTSLLGSLALLTVCVTALAQDQNLDAPAAAQAPPTNAAIPAVMANHSEKGLLLGIARAGDKLVAVGGNGVIVTSADGKAWTQVPSPVDVSLTGIAFADARHGWAVGHDALILGTEDGGQSWKIQFTQPDLFSPLFGVQALDAKRVLAVGAFGLLKFSDDGGGSWRDVQAPELTAEKFHINAVTRLNNGKLFVAGEQGLMGVSTDGLVWKRLKKIYEGSFFGALPWGERGAVAFGMRGNVFVATDVDSEDWKKLELGTTASFYGGQALGPDKLILTGAEGKILLLDSQGQPHDLQGGTESNLGQASSLTGSAVIGQTLVVVGDNGVLRFPAP